jgi:hypothetical protein
MAAFNRFVPQCNRSKLASSANSIGESGQQLLQILHFGRTVLQESIACAGQIFPLGAPRICGFVQGAK